MMNKSMLIGVALGVGFATAGGVTAYQLFGGPQAVPQGSAVVDESHDAHARHEMHDAQAAHEMSATAASSTQAAYSGRAPAPAVAPAAAAQPAAAIAQPAIAQPAPAPAAAQEECYEEVVASEPRDKRRIAGTAIGALVGGAVARDVGDRDLTTAVGAAVGAFAGNKIQERIQERNASSTTEVRCTPVR